MEFCNIFGDMNIGCFYTSYYKDEIDKVILLNTVVFKTLSLLWIKDKLLSFKNDTC